MRYILELACLGSVGMVMDGNWLEDKVYVWALRQKLTAQASPEFVIFCLSLISIECIYFCVLVYM